MVPNTLEPSGPGAQVAPTPTDAKPQGHATRPRVRTQDLVAPNALDKIWLVDPRVRPAAAKEDLLRFGIHGQYQVRYGSVPDISLNSYGFGNYRSSLGQTHRLEHYLRFAPTLSYRKTISIVTEFDLPRGMLLGQSTDHVDRDPEPLNERQPMRFVPRWFYVDIALERGHVTVGQQPAFWGQGLVDDSGDRPQFLGDPRLGTIVERVAFTGRPLGKRHPWELIVATDWVYSNGRVYAPDGDKALRAVLGNSYVLDDNLRFGALIIAERIYPHQGDNDLRQLSPKETTVTFDVAGHIARPIPGTSALAFFATEAAYVAGTTDLAEVLAPMDAKVRRFGAMARAGVMQKRGKDRLQSGPLGIAVEWGYASGDSNPGDGVDHQFTTNPGRRIGLVLFDEVLRWKTARSAVALEDPRLGQRQTGSAWAVPTAGGVGNATYLATQLLYRPLAMLDIRASAMVAQTASDLVDPAQALIFGTYSNFDGGRPTHRDLGLELDAGFEYRKPLENGLCASFGIEASTLTPGKALADASGHSLGQKSLVRGRFGFYF